MEYCSSYFPFFHVNDSEEKSLEFYRNEKEEVESNFDNIIKTVIEHFKWEPAAIGRLFWDNRDYEGLLYWYEYVLDYNRELKRKNG